MTGYVSKQFILASSPVGALRETDFSLTETIIPEPKQGEFVVRSHCFAVEAGMRVSLNGVGKFPPSVTPGMLMQGRSVAQVVASNHPDFVEGALVSGQFGWSEYALSDGAGLNMAGQAMPVKPVPKGVSAEAFLSLFGSTALAAYMGIMHVAKVQADDIVVVSGAAGAVGMVAVQIAKQQGARVIGITGSDAKCRWLQEELGVAAAINYRHKNMAAQLQQLAPEGVNAFFDNVGGAVLQAVLNNVAFNARIALCGAVSSYTSTSSTASQATVNEHPLGVIGAKDLFNLVTYGASMHGFSIRLMGDLLPQALDYLRDKYVAGELRSFDTRMAGFENLPKALVALYEGANKGKMLVTV